MPAEGHDLEHATISLLPQTKVDMMRNLFFAGLAAVAVAGCAGGDMNVTGGPDVELVQQGGLPPPDGVVPGAERPYRLGPLDKIKVDVFGYEELSREVQVDVAGKVSLPMIGQVDAAGKTPEELGELVRTGLRRNYVRDPQVSVNLVQAVSQAVTVDGEVRQPGVYPVLGEVTLMRAIATARGATEFAKLSQVVVFREVGGKQMAGLYSLKAIREGRYADPALYPGDVVVVGDSQARRVFKDIASMGGILTAPLTTIVR